MPTRDERDEVSNVLYEHDLASLRMNVRRELIAAFLAGPDWVKYELFSGALYTLLKDLSGSELVGIMDRLYAAGRGHDQATWRRLSMDKDKEKEEPCPDES